MTASNFRPAGTFPRPGLLGRGVRLLIGLMALYFFVQAVRVLPGIWRGGVPSSGLFWAGAALALAALPAFLDPLVGRPVGHRLRLAGIVLALGLAALDWTTARELPGPWLARLAELLLLTFTGLAGVSHLLAGLLGVPG